MILPPLVFPGWTIILASVPKLMITHPLITFSFKFFFNLPYFIEYNAHTNIVQFDFWQKIFLFFKNNITRINHCKFFHHKRHLKPFLSYLPCIVHKEYFSIIYSVKRWCTILDKIQYIWLPFFIYHTSCLLTVHTFSVPCFDNHYLIGLKFVSFIKTQLYKIIYLY